MIKVFALNLSMLYQFNLEPDIETSSRPLQTVLMSVQ